jgi:hypothetical protein
MRQRLAIAGVIASLALATTSTAQVNFTGTYSENFNSIGPFGSTPPDGWTIGFLGPSRVTDGGGAINPASLVVDDGNIDTVGQSFNYGSFNDTDRALGNMGTTGDGTNSGDRAIQLALFNNTGQTLNRLTVRFAGEQWRNNQAAAATPEQLRFFYSTSPASGWNQLFAPFEFVAPKNDNTAEGALNGNLAENRAADLGGTFSLNTPVPVGQTLYLRWLDWNDLNTQDHGLAIDDVVVIAPDVVPEPAGLSLLALAGVSLLARRRR